MTKTFITTLLTLFAFMANSQTTFMRGDYFQEIASAHTTQLDKAVGLNDEQRKKAYAILLDNATKIGGIKTKYPKATDASKAQIKGVTDKTCAALKGLFTMKQNMKFKAIEESFKTTIGS